MKLAILALCIVLILPTFICGGDEQKPTCECDYKTFCENSLQISEIVRPFLSEPTQVAALGRVARLGDLYDARSDQFMGISLYTSDLPADAISSIDISHSSIDYVKTESIEEKFQKLGVQPSLFVSFLGGLVSVSGSGNYLNQDKKSAKSAKTSFVYTIKTLREDLQIFSKSSKAVIDTFLLENVDATHVVVGIEWGASVVLSLEETNTNSINYKDVQRKLAETLDEIVFHIANYSDIDREMFDVEKSTSFSVQLSADILPNIFPQTIKHSFAFIQNIPDLIKTQNHGKGKSLNYILMPIQTIRKLFQVESNNTGIVNEIDTEIINDFLNVFQNMKDSELLIKDVHDSFSAFKLIVPKNELAEITEFKQKFFSFGNNFKKRFADSVVLFRSGKLDDRALTELVPSYEESNYTLATVKEVLGGYRTTMDKIELIKFLLTFNVFFIPFETLKYKIIEKSQKQEVYLISADLRNITSSFVNDLINLIKAESKEQPEEINYYVEDVPIRVPEIKVYSEGKITKTFSFDEKWWWSCFSFNMTLLDNNEYIFLKDRTGNVIILDGKTLEKIINYNSSDIANSLVAIVDDTFYNIDTTKGIILSTAVENIMNGSDAVNWTNVGSFPSEAKSIFHGVAVNNSFIYFVTKSGTLYLFDTTLKNVTKMGAVEAMGDYSSLAIVNGILYIYKEDKFYSFDGATIKDITTPESRKYCGLFQLGSLVCRVGGNTDYTNRNSDSVSCYNPSDETWDVTSYINQSRYFPGITTTKSGTYVFGGLIYDSGDSFQWFNSVEVFNPETNIWSSVPSPLSSKPPYLQAVTFYY